MNGSKVFKRNLDEIGLTKLGVGLLVLQRHRRAIVHNNGAPWKERTAIVVESKRNIILLRFGMFDACFREYNVCDSLFIDGYNCYGDSCSVYKRNRLVEVSDFSKMLS
jgi:hypothetical protein